MTGTGDLAEFNRHISMPVSCDVHNAPRTEGDPVQIFATEMTDLYGQLFGDPDFCELIIRAGVDRGLPSPGETTLKELPGGDFAVDSFFDITYEIEFEGCPGSQLEGYSGITVDRTRIATCHHQFPEPPCCLGDNNTHNTVDLPADCPYANASEPMRIVTGLPPGDSILLHGPLRDFSSISNGFGGTLGGEIAAFDGAFVWSVVGAGNLAGFTRQISMPVSCVVHMAPRTPGDPTQTFATDMFRLQGQLFGDPDFCELVIRGGADLGLPSPGQTRLVELPSGDFAVDSFFDIAYEIDFEGCPGSMLEGHAGTTRRTNRVFTCSAEAATPEPFEIHLTLPSTNVQLTWQEVFGVRTYEVYSTSNLVPGLVADPSGTFPSNTTWRAPAPGDEQFYRVHGETLW